MKQTRRSITAGVIVPIAVSLLSGYAAGAQTSLPDRLDVPSAVSASEATVVPVTFSSQQHSPLGAPFIDIKMDCRDAAPGHPYVVFDREGPFAPYRYVSEDGTPIGHYPPSDQMPWSFRHITEGGLKITAIAGAAHALHRSVTFYCSSTLEDANQSW